MVCQHEYARYGLVTACKWIFSGKFRRDNLHTFGEREWDEVVVRTYATEANFQRLERAEFWQRKKTSPPHRSPWHM